jgi:hypothetical protein
MTVSSYLIQNPTYKEREKDLFTSLAKERETCKQKWSNAELKESGNTKNSRRIPDVLL